MAEKVELIEGETYIIDANYYNSSEVVLLRKYGELYCTVKSIDSDYQWETMQNRLTAKPESHELAPPKK